MGQTARVPTRRLLGSGPDAVDAVQAPRAGRPATVAELAAAAADAVGHDLADRGEEPPVATPPTGRRSLGDGPSS
ncbi:hypothetical protein ACWGCW_27990 [Streptomyces sp. NPDC054933]